MTYNDHALLKRQPRVQVSVETRMPRLQSLLHTKTTGFEVSCTSCTSIPNESPSPPCGKKAALTPDTKNASSEIHDPRPGVC